ncbi:hypothetical protein GFS24_09895 [Chitinophaga sp. SYP-B3965]|uniref:hypothetical protein n=1 Tax=Chitinophaga sp. SYP-B3965 TaxID=2663120 RepID=UPI0012997E95|nr:hypothetical protein [Chitinophaga sp. SYP-B3965]MRG45428.1 hypothetical protein [Chitinophaga sp. SYP-B3965]
MSKIRISLVAALMGTAITLISLDGMAQGIDSTIKKVGDKTASTAKKVGNKTASTAVKGASAIKDKIYKGKQAPGGEVVYIDAKDRKYFVDEKGKKVYLKPSQIKNKE